MKQAVLIVSFGTSYHESRKKHIEAIEKALEDQLKEYTIRRAFTSRKIIEILKERDELEIDGVTESLDRLKTEGFEKVLIQPTLVMGGEEYDRMLADIEAFKDQFEKLAVGKPLLADEEDYQRLLTILAEDTLEYNLDGTEIIFMGHGTEHPANCAYERLAQQLKERGFHRYHVGTVEAEPSFETMKEEVMKTDSKRLILQPLMIVAGDHAHNDMAGRDADSWKSQLESEGYEVICRLKGLGELKGIQQIFVEHAKEAEKML